MTLKILPSTLVGLLTVGCAIGNVGATNGPQCLLGLCIGAKAVSERAAEDLLRLPPSRRGIDWGIEYRCYSFAAETHVKLGVLRPDDIVVAIDLSSFEHCGNSSSKVDKVVPRAVTPEGLKMGDSTNTVLGKYGAPESIIDDKVKFDRWLGVGKISPKRSEGAPLETLYIYGPPERQGEFRIIGFDRSGRVALIRIYAGP